MAAQEPQRPERALEQTEQDHQKDEERPRAQESERENERHPDSKHFSEPDRSETDPQEGEKGPKRPEPQAS